MGVHLTGLSYIYGDNVYAIHNTQIPESNLNNNKKSIFYHSMRYSVTMAQSLTSHIPNKFNLSVMLMKTLFGQDNSGLV